MKFYECSSEGANYFTIIVQASNEEVAIQRANRHLELRKRPDLKITMCRLLALDNKVLYSTVGIK